MLLIYGAADAEAFELGVTNGKLTVNADHVPLQDLLKVLSYNGVVVRIDPKINPLVSAAFKEREMEEGLKMLLKPNNHAFVWRPVPPFPEKTNASYQLEEIHVFRPGEKDLMVSIDTSDLDRPRIDEMETLVIILDNKIYVPVTLGYQDKEYETTLVLDTSASGMVIHQNVADQLGIEQTQPSTDRGVGGIEVDTRLVQLQYVSVGPHEKKNLKANIIDYQRPEGESNELYNGVLGLSFFNDYPFVIDYYEQIIKWRP
jgi:hypothetical protein